MNGNLSNVQQSQTPAMNKTGAMPVSNKFDGPAPIKTPNTQGVLQPGKNILIPKPGFF